MTNSLRTWKWLMFLLICLLKMAMFHRFLYVYQRVHHKTPPKKKKTWLRQALERLALVFPIQLVPFLFFTACISQFEYTIISFSGELSTWFGQFDQLQLSVNFRNSSWKRPSTPSMAPDRGRCQGHGREEGGNKRVMSRHVLRSGHASTKIDGFVCMSEKHLKDI
jgi:hypothetical protein